MEDAVKLLNKIAPEIVDTVEERCMILRNIYINQPIGRRALARTLSWSERKLRTEAKLLEDLGLLKIDQKGMELTIEGKVAIKELDDFVFCIKGLGPIAQKIKKRFNCRHVTVVQGNSDIDDTIKLQLGKEAAKILKKIIKNYDIIAVTGGTTMAQIPKCIDYMSGLKDVVVVPGRGGLGERVELESNTIAAELSKKLNAKYRLLYVPDNLSAEAMESVVNEPGIREVINIIRRTNILLHGIGGAEEVARRRGVSPEEIEIINSKGAVAEAFGYYFDHEGKIVHTTTSVGLTIKDMDNIDTVIAIAGGAKKAPAIQAFLKYHNPTVLITDEGAARKLLQIEGGD